MNRKQSDLETVDGERLFVHRVYHAVSYLTVATLGVQVCYGSQDSAERRENGLNS